MAVSYANRGKAFEGDIIRSNISYKHKKWAFIEKTEPIFKQVSSGLLPTSWRGGKKHYKVGYYEGKGFVDFFGVCQGRALAFEAKSTTNRTSFPLKNISKEQIEDLSFWNNQGGISFVLIQFETQREVYVLRFIDLQKWWDESLAGKRKSIPYEWFVLNCEKVKATRGIILDYLNCLGIQ
ncbi:Holliday junction resolvase RecU [Peribacillus frigoritolerans]|uniref:Holliday junction resolvase RecU n=1 Tax=Peribacillus frigoritolerans TaxID=450367 RepID=UPI00207A3B4B|nr:Holliday junction resolvase RecU [Peribacillus frigoritolerans]USK77734.1 Holliday junction resolvase RecU [Peribacillus frigoritolerans]USK77813.1 Holliday junction resolvase RecU [Peribacillus frigoritolerans]USK77856.1 Holliday junction resolvase RecU [Peribacillus frigoritolerans]